MGDYDKINMEKNELINELINELAEKYNEAAMKRDEALDEYIKARKKYLVLRIKATNYYNEWLRMVTGND